MDESIKSILLEAVWCTRWNKDKTAIMAVLTEEEADKMCEEVVKELDNGGYKITRKKKRKFRFFHALRKIIIIPIAFTHVALSGILYFPIVWLLFGLTKANKFMDEIVINYMVLFDK